MAEKKQLFGTNGVRGVVGESMTPGLVLRIGQALGAMRPGTIAIGRDTRTSGPILTHALKAGLMAAGCHVVDCVSEENGWRNTNLGDFTVRSAIPAHFYMAGYTFAKGTRLVNCRSVHNRNYGFYDEQNGNNVLERCIDIGSGYGYKICKNVQRIVTNPSLPLSVRRSITVNEHVWELHPQPGVFSHRSSW